MGEAVKHGAITFLNMMSQFATPYYCIMFVHHTVAFIPLVIMPCIIKESLKMKTEALKHSPLLQTGNGWGLKITQG